MSGIEGPVTHTRATALHGIEPRGAFDLRQSVEFGFGQRRATGYDGTMALAMCLDGYTDQAAVRLRPDGSHLVCEVVGPDADAAVSQAARVLSLDVDARGYDELGGRDELVGRLQAARPGLRPPLFHSAYEAVAWSLLSARRPHQQAARLRDRLARQHGRVFEVGGRSLAAFPTPVQLLGVEELPGLPAVALQRLHALAEEARDGGLDTGTLRALAPAEAAARLQRLPGIGPFYAELVTVRALGHTDVLPRQEATVRELAGRLTGRPGGTEPLDEDRFAQLAGAWAPWRTWVGVALRAAGPVLLGSSR
jgi:DNA-3-methyladenine glycosylase II